jgi:hypothetical protein
MAIGYRLGEVEDPLDPVNSVFALSAENVFQCLPEGRLDVVEVGENGESGAKTAVDSGMCTGGDLERRWI